MRKSFKVAIAGAITAVALGLGSLGAVAATSSPAPAVPNKLCYNAGGSVIAVHNTCPDKYKTYTLSLGKTGPKGATGPRGLTGKTGPQGVQGVPGKDGKAGANGGVVWNGTTHMLDLSGPISVPTGGGFNANATLVGTLTFASAGYWDIQVNAKVTPNASGDTAEIFPQLFVYTQPKGDFSNDLFNIGDGALEPDGTNHDSYLNGSMTVFIANPATKIYVYAFGYDSDKGAGSYVLDSVNVTNTEFANAG